MAAQNYSINPATTRAINKDDWPRPRAINSPRRSRGLLIVRGRGQLSFNPTTTRRINKDNWPRPRTINSPRRSRGLLIVRGRGQLSFNPTATGRIHAKRQFQSLVIGNISFFIIVCQILSYTFTTQCEKLSWKWTGLRTHTNRLQLAGRLACDAFAAT